MKKGVNWKVLIASFLIVFGLLAGLSSLLSPAGANTEWYQSIKPAITPPGWVFPIVWNILFILISLSLYFVWANTKNKEQKTEIVWAYGANFIFNILWSLFFFGMEKPLLSFLDIILVWLTIVFAIIVAGKISKKAAWLLVPYLLWVSFASILNAIIAFG